MKLLIIIPARGGSKGIPNKNLVKLVDKPLIQYTLDTAKELMKNQNHKWIPFVSTDDDNISTFCSNHGFDMTYKRPKELAGDRSTNIDVILDALNWLDHKKNIKPDALLLLQPTTPLRKATDIFNAIKKVESKNNFSIVSVTRMREHPNECIVKNKKGWSYLTKPAYKTAGRQDYNDDYFFIDGNFYFASVEFLIENRTFLIENRTKFYLLDQSWPIDIDEVDDLLVAESFLNKYEKTKKN